MAGETSFPQLKATSSINALIIKRRSQLTELALFAGRTSWVYFLSLPFKSGFGNIAVEEASRHIWQPLQGQDWWWLQDIRGKIPEEEKRGLVTTRIHRVREQQNGWGRKGPPEAHWIQTLAQAGTPRAGCPGNIFAGNINLGILN